MAEDRVRELINWTDVDVLYDFEPPNPSIAVRGTLPYPMDVELEPFPEALDAPAVLAGRGHRLPRAERDRGRDPVTS